VRVGLYRARRRRRKTNKSPINLPKLSLRKFKILRPGAYGLTTAQHLCLMSLLLHTAMAFLRDVTAGVSGIGSDASLSRTRDSHAENVAI